MVDVEERRLEVGLDAVGDEQPLDHADQRVLLARLGRSAVRALEVAEHRHVLRQRDPVDRLLLGGDRRVDVPATVLGPRQRVVGRRVAGEGSQRRRAPARAPARPGRPRTRPCSAARASTPRSRPGRATPRARAAAPSERRRRRRAAAGACPTRAYERDVGPQRGHRVERLESLVVAPELDERIADHAVVARRRGRDRARAAAKRERFAEAVPRERERAEAAGRDQVVRREAQRPAKNLVGLRCSRSGRPSRVPAAGRRGRARRARRRRRGSRAARSGASRSASPCPPPPAAGAIGAELALRRAVAARRRGAGR